MKNDFTVEFIENLHPCAEYTHAKIVKLFAGREILTGLDILNLDISAGHKTWVLLRPEVLSKRELLAIGEKIARHVLPIWEAKYPDDNRPRMCLDTILGYLAGENTETELAAARDAAWDAWAARDAAWDAEILWQIETLKSFWEAADDTAKS